MTASREAAAASPHPEGQATATDATTIAAGRAGRAGDRPMTATDAPTIAPAEPEGQATAR